MGGFPEECFEAIWKSGRIVQNVLLTIPEDKRFDWMYGMNETLLVGLLSQAYATFPRIEPLVDLGIYFSAKNNYHMAYMYLLTACDSEQPTNSVLFLETDYYDYIRWHFLGRIAYYVGKYTIGMNAATKALKGRNLHVDVEVMKFYTDRLKSTRRKK